MATQWGPDDDPSDYEDVESANRAVGYTVLAAILFGAILVLALAATGLQP